MSIHTSLQLLIHVVMLLIWSIIALLPVSLGFALTVSLMRALKVRGPNHALATRSDLPIDGQWPSVRS
jgi:hypothetical protein